MPGSAVRQVELPTQAALDILSSEIKHQRDYFDAKFTASHEAVRVALASNDRRLDGMNEFRQALNDTTNKMITRVEAIATIQNQAASQTTEIATLREKLEQMGKPNYVMMGSVMSMLFVLITGVWVVIGLKIDTSTAPIQLEVASVTAKQVQQEQRLNLNDADRAKMSLLLAESASTDEASKNDRVQLGSRLKDVEAAQHAAMVTRTSGLAAIWSEFARVSTWMTFAQHKLFEGQPLPPQATIPK